MFLFLLEAIGLTGLIGLFPPLRGMLVVTGSLVALLGAFTTLVIRMAVAGRPARTRTLPALSDVVAVLPEARPEPEFEIEERDRRVLRIAAR